MVKTEGIAIGNASRVNNLSGYNNDPEVTFLQFIYSVHSVDVIN